MGKRITGWLSPVVHKEEETDQGQIDSFHDTGADEIPSLCLQGKPLSSRAYSLTSKNIEELKQPGVLSPDALKQEEGTRSQMDSSWDAEDNTPKISTSCFISSPLSNVAHSLSVDTPANIHNGLLSPEVLKEDDALQGQIRSSPDTESDTPEVPTRRLRRRPVSSRILSRSLQEHTPKDICDGELAGEKTSGHSRSTSVCVSEGLRKRQRCRNPSRKRHICSVCEKPFSYKSELDAHVRTHTGEKPFKCSVCEKSFAMKYNRDLHIRTHTGERPFKCNICMKSFLHKGHLNHHVRIHTGERPFKCNVCGKSFSQKCNRDVHTRTHTGERPFKCNICTKAFLHKKHLDCHILTHTVGGPFKYGVCEKSQKCQLHMGTCSHAGAVTFT